MYSQQFGENFENRIEELERYALPLMRLAGDRVPGDYKFFGAMYGLKGHLLHEYKFRIQNVHGPYDEYMRGDLNMLVGDLGGEIPDNWEPGMDTYLYLTENGKHKADMYLRDMEKTDKRGLEILKRTSDILRKSKHQESATELYKSVQKMRSELGRKK